MNALRNALRCDHIDDEFYILRSACHPFLQDDDESRCHESKGWALVEFWAYDRAHIEAWVRAVYNHIWGSEPQELIFVE